MRLKIFSLLFLLSHLTLTAQEFLHYSTREGLPGNTVYDVKQDIQGFMWFATEHGVVKFDGDSFTTFSLENGLANNDVWRLSTTFDGKVWFMSKSNRQGYIKNDSVYLFAVDGGKSITPDIVHTNGDRIWLAGKAKETYELKDSVFYTMQFLQDPMYKAINNTNAIYRKPFFNPDSNSFLRFKKNFLQVLDTDYTLTKQIELKGLPENFFQLKACDYGVMPRHIFHITNENGALFIDVKKGYAKYISFEKVFGKDKVRVSRCNTLKSEIQLSIPGHLMILNYNFEILEKYHFDKAIDNENSYKDMDGNIWLTSLNKGVYVITAPHLQAKQYLKYKNVQHIGLINDTIITGVTGKTYYRYNDKTGTFKDLGIPSEHVFDIISGRNNYLVSHRETLKFTSIKQLVTNRSIRYPGYKDLIEYKGLIHAIQFSGIHIFNLSDENVLKSIPEIKKEGLKTIEVFNDQIYVGGSHGLSVIDNNKLVDTKVQVPINFLVKNDQFLFIGTKGNGVYLYAENAVIHIESTKRLDVQKIVVKENFLWLATHKGVHVVKLDYFQTSKSKIINSIYWEDGLFQNDLNDILLAENFLFTSSNIGVSKIDLSNPIYTRPPKLYFKARKDTLHFKDHQRVNIWVAFNVLNYHNQKNYQYEFRLKPGQKDWTKTFIKTIHFSNLDPKVYQLEVKATDQHGNQTIKKKYIKVYPYWHETTVAKVIFVVLIGIILVSIYYLLLKRERRKGLIKKQTSELELKALRSQMNPHFVHNCINSIQYYIQRNDIEASEKYLMEFSKLIRYFFEHSRQKTVSISAEIQLLTSYLNIEKLRFEDKLSYQITVQNYLDIQYDSLPSSILQPIVENAVNHGIFHKKDQGRIHISFKKINWQTLEVTIEDNGVGVQRSAEIQQKFIKTDTSHSTEVIYERISLLNQAKNWKIDYTLEDINSKEIDTGTRVCLTFKKIKYES